ncbi:MFS transporter [Streptomyces sp. NPDC086989]|uniref:MFS transporter n=1 Tax=Streptomyces sp. NPDC086989 TaxID=3365764 RepID=UPI00380A6B62
MTPCLPANRGYTSGILVAVAFFASFTGLMTVLSLCLQGPLGLSPQGAGYAIAPRALGIAAAAGPAGALARRRGRVVIQCGTVLTVLGPGLLAACAGGVTDGWRLVPGTFATGLGMGLVIPPLFDVILAGVAEPEVGSASGVLNAVQQLANAVGVALLVTVWSAFTDHGRTPAAALTPSVRVPRRARA